MRCTKRVRGRQQPREGDAHNEDASANPVALKTYRSPPKCNGWDSYAAQSERAHAQSGTAGRSPRWRSDRESNGQRPWPWKPYRSQPKCDDWDSYAAHSERGRTQPGGSGQLPITAIQARESKSCRPRPSNSQNTAKRPDSLLAHMNALSDAHSAHPSPAGYKRASCLATTLSLLPHRAGVWSSPATANFTGHLEGKPFAVDFPVRLFQPTIGHLGTVPFPAWRRRTRSQACLDAPAPGSHRPLLIWRPHCRGSQRPPPPLTCSAPRACRPWAQARCPNEGRVSRGALRKPRVRNGGQRFWLPPSITNIYAIYNIWIHITHASFPSPSRVAPSPVSPLLATYHPVARRMTPDVQ